MTYCVAMSLADGLVFISDTRTNGGVDHIATFRKLHVFGIDGERVIVLQCAGNLATSQSVISLLSQRLQADGPSLYSVQTMFEVARLVGQTLREVLEYESESGMTAGIDMGCSILVGGQIAGYPPGLFNLYPQGNFIAATQDTPYFQIGESKYGKPILDRVLGYDTDLERALRCALISFDSTIRSNLSVGMPLDLLVYRRDTLRVSEGYRVEDGDPYYQGVRQQWCSGLRQLLHGLPPVPGDYLS